MAEEKIPEIRRTQAQIDTPAEEAAEKLLSAWVEGSWINKVEDFPIVSSLDQVYAIHRASAAATTAEKLGGVCGYKQGGIGAALPAPAVYGLLFGCGMIDSPAGLSVSKFNLFNIEAEIAFVLSSNIHEHSAPFTELQIWENTNAIYPCIELCGCRHKLMGNLSNLQKLADYSCAGGVVKGRWYSTSDVSIKSITNPQTKVVIDGKVKATGAGSNCPLGSPLASITWCVNHLASRGISIADGTVIISGATCKTQDFGVGQKIEVTIGDLEPVIVNGLPM